MMEEMKTMEHLSDICSMKDTLITAAKSQLAQGVEHVNAKELGEVMDCIKDLAETKKLCMEAAYYEAVVCAMEEGPDYPESMGYNHRHMMNGQFASRGRGIRTGYNHNIREMPYINAYLHDPDFEEQMRMEHMGRMGYGDGRSMNSSDGYSNSDRSRGDYGSSRNYHNGYSSEDGYGNNSRHGKAYNDYVEHRRHYTSSHDSSDKDMMDRAANEHVADTMLTIRDIYKSADPDMKKRLKADLTKLVSEMT